MSRIQHLKGHGRASIQLRPRTNLVAEAQAVIAWFGLASVTWNGYPIIVYSREISVPAEQTF